MTTPLATRFTLLSPNAGTTLLEWDWLLTDDAGMRLVRRRDGGETILIQGVDYTIRSGVGNPAGGTLLLMEGSLAADEYHLIGLQPVRRQSDFSASSSFDTAKHNADLDFLTRTDQELRRDADRALKTAYGAPPLLPLPAPEPGKVLAGNAAGDGYVNAPVSEADIAAAVDAAQTAALAAGASRDQSAVSAAASLASEEAAALSAAAAEAARAFMEDVSLIPFVAQWKDDSGLTEGGWDMDGRLWVAGEIVTVKASVPRAGDAGTVIAAVTDGDGGPLIWQGEVSHAAPVVATGLTYAIAAGAQLVGVVIEDDGTAVTALNLEALQRPVFA
jgi:hypothetical protein